VAGTELRLYSLIIFLCLAPCSSRFLAPAAQPPLAPLVRLRPHCRHVKLDAIQHVSRPAAPPCRGSAAPSTHRRRGVEGARERVCVAPAQRVRGLVRGLPQARLLRPRRAVHLGVLYEYDLQLQHLNPNNIQQMAAFEAMCEGYC
jgi:hypothetical protein